MFATRGFQVLGVDVNERVVETLNNGEVHIHEPGLRVLVQAALKSGSLRVTRQPETADVFIICVPTPFKEIPDFTDSMGGTNPSVRSVRSMVPKEADLSFVIAAAESVVPHLRPGNLVVLESTVPPRTTVDILIPILERSGLRVSRGAEKPGSGGAEKQGSRGAMEKSPPYPCAQPPLYVAHCPERVLPGRILEELIHNDRVIGGVDQTSAEMAKALYASFVEGEIFLTDATTAEMVKLMENTYRDVNIALANEFALVAEKLGINIWEAIELANHHPRVNILRPGPGVGGHCIAVDPWFIVQVAREVTPLIQTARRVNDGMPAHVVSLVQQQVAGIERPVIAVLGLAYKADVDDVRESPALRVIEGLEGLGYELRICDPHVNAKFPWPLLPIPEVMRGADCLLLLTDHSEFRALRPQEIGPLMRHRLLVDTRGYYKICEWVAEGFRVITLGVAQ